MAAMQKNDEAQLTAMLSAAERFVFTIGRLCKLRADTGDSDFYRLAGDVFRGDKTPAEADQFVQERTNSLFSATKTRETIRDLFFDGEGFYSWAGLRYFLFEYEQHLKTLAGMQTVRLNWVDFTSSKKDHVTIEHIFPETPDDEEWPEFAKWSSYEQHKLRHSLGNLLALSQSRNSKASNRPFARKRQDDEGVQGYFNGSYSEINVAQFPDWTPATVLERGLAMIDFMELNWKISLGTRAEKVKLLGLDFLEPDPSAQSASAAI
jgi:hypothetical protein